MLRSLFAGISGLRVNQTMLDVTGNNIANANTIGFKCQHHRLPGHPQPDAAPAPARPAPAAAAPTRSRSASASRSPRPAATSPRARPRPPARATDLMIQGDGMFVPRHGQRARSTPAPARSPSTRPAPWSPPPASRVQGYALDDAGGPPAASIDITLDPPRRPAAPRGRRDDVVQHRQPTASCAASSPTTCSATWPRWRWPTSPTPPGLEQVGETVVPRESANSGAARARRRRPGQPRRPDRRRAGDVERRPRRRVHQPDPRPARLPGQLARDHHLRPGARGAGQHQALTARRPVAWLPAGPSGTAPSACRRRDRRQPGSDAFPSGPGLRRPMDGVEAHGRPSTHTHKDGAPHDYADPTLGLRVRPERRPDRARRQHARHRRHPRRRQEVRRRRGPRARSCDAGARRGAASIDRRRLARRRVVARRPARPAGRAPPDRSASPATRTLDRPGEA